VHGSCSLFLVDSLLPSWSLRHDLPSLFYGVSAHSAAMVGVDLSCRVDCVLVPYMVQASVHEV
jgi:hypothetical protein